MLLFVKWFFTVAPRQILRVGWTFARWAWKEFSIGYFPPRLFAPWHRDLSSYGRGFDLRRILHVMGWNLISRVIGAVLRLVVLAFGLAVEAVFLPVIAVVLVVWIALPFASVAFIALGIIGMFP